MNQSAQPYFARSWAVVVGVNDYAPPIRSLVTAVSDARSLLESLREEHGFGLATTCLLTGIEATRNNLRLELARVAMGASVGDRFLFYFAGHGVGLDASNKGRAGRILLADAKAENPDSFLAMADLEDWLEKVQCRHSLVILDCCFAAAFRTATRDLIPDESPLVREWFFELVRDDARLLLASAAHNQKAVDTIAGLPATDREPTVMRDAGGDHSPFAQHLLFGIRGAADSNRDGVITCHDLFAYLQREVPRIAPGQTPQLWPLRGHGNGDFLFFVPGRQFNASDLLPALEVARLGNPYRGERPYEIADQCLYFGREELAAQVATTIATVSKVLLVGPSSVGKTSFVRAGVCPLLTKHGWRVLITSGAPISNRAALLQELHKLGSSLAEGTALTVVRAILGTSSDLRVVLCLDELAIADDPDGCELEKEVRQLATLSMDANLIDTFRLVIVARSERALGARSSLQPDFTECSMGKASLDSFYRSIHMPLREAVLFFRPAVLSEQLMEWAIDGMSPVVSASIVLARMYEGYIRSGRRDRLIQVDAPFPDGLNKELTAHANQVLDEAIETGIDEDEFWKILFRLISPGRRGLTTRQADLWEFDANFPGRKHVLNLLTQRRLTIVGPHPEQEARTLVSLAHPALTTWEWLLKRGTAQSVEEQYKLRDRLCDAVFNWKRTGRVWVPSGVSRSVGRLHGTKELWLCKNELRLLELHQRHRRMFLGVTTSLAGASLSVAPVIQLLSTRLSVEGTAPEAVVVRRGASALDWMPYPFQDKLLYDTGLTTKDFSAEDRPGIERTAWRSHLADVELLTLVRPVLHEQSQLRCMVMVGDWAALATVASKIYAGDGIREQDIAKLVQGLVRYIPSLPVGGAMSVWNAVKDLPPMARVKSLPPLIAGSEEISKLAAHEATKLASVVDKTVRENAIIALEQLPQSNPIDPIPLLVDLLQNGEDGVSYRAQSTLTELGKTRGSAIVQAIGPLFNTKDPDRIQQILLCLENITPKALQPLKAPLTQLLAVAYPAYVRSAAGHLLAAMGRLDDENILQVVLDCISLEDVGDRGTIVMGLMLLEQLPSRMVQLAKKQIEAIFRRDDLNLVVRASEFLIKAAQAGDPRVARIFQERLAALRLSLHRSSQTFELPPFGPLPEGEDNAVKYDSLADQLLQIASGIPTPQKEIIQELTTWLEIKNRQLLAAAGVTYITLRAAGADLKPSRLPAELASWRKDEVREAIAAGLRAAPAAVKDEATVLLLQLARDSVFYVRRTAVFSIGLVGHGLRAKVLEALRPGLEGNETRWTGYIASTLASLFHDSPDLVTSLFEKLLADQDQELREVGAISLATVAGHLLLDDSQRQHYRAFLQDDNLRIRRIMSLLWVDLLLSECRAMSDTVSDHLFALLKSDDSRVDARFREVIIGALGRWLAISAFPTEISLDKRAIAERSRIQETLVMLRGEGTSTWLRDSAFRIPIRAATLSPVTVSAKWVEPGIRWAFIDESTRGTQEE